MVHARRPVPARLRQALVDVVLAVEALVALRAVANVPAREPGREA